MCLILWSSRFSAEQKFLTKKETAGEEAVAFLPMFALSNLKRPGYTGIRQTEQQISRLASAKRFRVS